jgi:hypothetical protein
MEPLLKAAPCFSRYYLVVCVISTTNEVEKWNISVVKVRDIPRVTSPIMEYLTYIVRVNRKPAGHEYGHRFRVIDRRAMVSHIAHWHRSEVAEELSVSIGLIPGFLTPIALLVAIFLNLDYIALAGVKPMSSLR